MLQHDHVMGQQQGLLGGGINVEIGIGGIEVMNGDAWKSHRAASVRARLGNGVGVRGWADRMRMRMRPEYGAGTRAWEVLERSPESANKTRI